MKKIVAVIFLLVLTCPLLRASEPAPTLNELLAQARERNPDVRAAYQKWKVTEKEASAASSWPNPIFSYVAEKDPVGQEGVEPLDRRHYAVSQDIPFPGKLSNETGMKHHEALIAEAKYIETVLETDRRLKLAYYKLYAVDRLIELEKINTELLRSTLASAQGRLSANLGSSSDVFMSQTALHESENRLYEQEQERKLVEIELNSIFNDPPDKSWPASVRISLNDLPFSLEKALEMAEANNPLYRSSSHEINHSRAMLSRSKLELAPDFGVMYEYQTAGSGGGVGPAGRQIGLSLSVPLWLKRPLSQKAGAEAHVIEAQAMAESMQNMVRKMTAMEYTEVQTHLQLARTIESEILPPAKAGFTTAREQYAAGRGDFMRVLEANRAWVKAGQDFQDQLNHYSEHWSELERWIGTELDSNLEKEKENPHEH